MQTTIALFRGINVGGHNKLPMAELRALLTEMGLQDVKSYIQSGNIVFRTNTPDDDILAEQISKAIEDRFGFLPRVLLIGLVAYRKAIAANPFPDGEDEPKSLHLYFLTEEPTEPNLALLDEVRKESERFQLIDDVFYLYAPEGIGRSKLAERVERVLGVSVTARNWRSACKILDLAQQVEDG